MCPRVPMERGTTWRWMFSVWLSVFCGVIVKESDLYSRKTAFGSDLYQLWDIWRFSPVCRISFPSGSLHSLRISWQIPPPFHRACAWDHLSILQDCAKGWMSWIPGCPWKPLPSSQQTAERVNTITPRLSSCWSLRQHSPQLRHCLISSAVAINIYKP